MKKAISLLLALVLALSLCACGGAEQGKETQAGQTEPQIQELNLFQEWKAVSNGAVIRFDESGTCTIYGENYPYEYVEAESKIVVEVYGMPVGLAITQVDGIYRIDVEGTEFAPAEAYEKLHEQYAQTMMAVPGFDGTPALNEALVEEHLERVELTVDNWREYIKVYSYDVEVVEKDAFGEITNTEKHTVIRMGYGTEQYHYLDAIIELQHKQTGETVIYAPASHQGRSFILTAEMDLEEYDCTRIKGYLYFIDYPEEVMTQVLNVYDRTGATRENAEIQVTSGSFEGTWRVDCDAMVISNGSGSFGDYFE